jgi:5-bromo-4-chloroindolyl phosphate hydrolysis protein
VESVDAHEREVRAARNQSLFRAINEKLKGINEALNEATGTFVIACECADTSCLEMLEIEPDQYEAIRANPRHFAVRPGHLYPDVEDVVGEYEAYTIVEKIATAGELAEAIATRDDQSRA